MMQLHLRNDYPVPSEPANSETKPADVPVVLFDDQCDMCRRGVRTLERMCGGRATAAPLPPTADGSPPEEMKLVMPDGRVYGGAEAIVRALSLRRPWRYISWVYFLPGIRQMANAAYRLVARHRRRGGS
jgi:predicted DCC family thiol-disulfide oxidoreductase YuxK